MTPGADVPLGVFFVPRQDGVVAFELPTHTRLAKQIFVADKGDYYDIFDGLPQSLEY